MAGSWSIASPVSNPLFWAHQNRLPHVYPSEVHLIVARAYAEDQRLQGIPQGHILSLIAEITPG
jgi:hypothetical protein